jgi:iduronate 2-sulfatase
MKNLLILLAFGGLTLAHAASPAKPNVVLILVDDLKPLTGAYGDKHAITPELDRLAAKGVRFDSAYCNQAVCAPSRFNLMLSARSTTLGIYNFGSNFRDSYPAAVTLPQLFKNHGYRTESMGKIFHIGHGTHGDDASWSLPHHKDLVIEYVDPRSKPDGSLTKEEALFSNQPSKGLPRGAAWESPDVADEAYADGRIAAYAIKRLQHAKQNPAEPFFLAVGFARPHLPFSAPKKYWDLYDPAQLPLPANEKAPVGAKGVKLGGEIVQYTPVPPKLPASGLYDEPLKRTLIHGYYASTSYVDAQIGKVVRAIDELGLAENTIIVLWGDHGFHLGDLGIWTKHTNFEQANRIPLLIVAPSVTKPGTATRSFAETVDIYPTLAELAGLPMPKQPFTIDGVSQAPSLKNPAIHTRDHAYHCYPRDGLLGRAIRTARYRLVEWRTHDQAATVSSVELYDYVADPLETKNHAAENPAVVAELQALLDRHPAPRTPLKASALN